MAKFHVELDIDEIILAVREYLARQNIEVADSAYIEMVDSFGSNVSDPCIKIEDVNITGKFNG